MIMFVRYRYREPNGLIKLEAAAAGSQRRSGVGCPLSLAPPLFYLLLAQPRFDTAVGAEGGRGRRECALVNPPSRSPISCISR